MPQTILAPSVTLAAVRNLTVFGHSFADQDGKLTQEGLCAFWTIVSFFAAAIAYKTARIYSPIIFGKTYTKLPVLEQREWDSRYSSMWFSPACVWFAYVMLWDSDFFYEDGDIPNVLRTHDITYTMLGVALGFFLVDFAVCFKYHLGGNAMILHHIGSLASVVTAIATGNCHMHAVWMLLTEFTTPFINLRWWFDKADMKSSPLYLYNGIAIFVGWLVARIFSFPPFFYVVYQQRAQIVLLGTASKLLMCVFPPLLTVLNLWWFSKIFRGVMKLLSQEGAKPKTA